MAVSIDRLVRTRRKSIALVIENDGSLTVRAPLHLSSKSIQAFIESHQNWITRAKAKVQVSALPTRRFAEGEHFLFMGAPFPLKFTAEKSPALRFESGTFLMSRSALPRAEESFRHWYKNQARKLFTERVIFQANRYGFQYQKIRISSARTRWGSCSSRGTLSFTYRLVMAPPDVVDYVVLHELVHTRIRNHSQTFWLALADLMPDYKKRLVWLKKNGKFLF